jgi:DNA primase
MRPRFDPRGLVRFEGKLKVDIRVCVLPEGKDPDDVIRNEPERWVGLVDQAKSVAEFVIDALLVGRDLSNPKDKAAVTDEVVPFIRDIADPVERSAYAQQLARRLKVDERAVIRQVETAATPAKPVRASRAGESPAPKREADRERYCLIELLRAPYALHAIDDALARADLPPFGAEDFESVTHREVFLAIHSAPEETGGPSLDEVLDRLDPSLHVDVLAWLESSPPRPPWGPDVDETRGVVDAALLLRERNLRTQGAQIEDLIRSASEEGDTESIRELGQAKLALSDQMRRLSRLRYAPEFIRQSYAESGR